MRDTRFLASEPYLQQQPLVVYKSGSLRPRTLDDLVGRDLVIVAGSVHLDTLIALKQGIPKLSWREIHAADSMELMQLVTDEKADLAIIDSIEFSIQQQLFPRIVAALEIGEAAPVVWYLPQSASAQASLEMINAFLTSAQASGQIAQLEREHFGRWKHASRVGSITFQRKIREDLPRMAAVNGDDRRGVPNGLAITGGNGLSGITLGARRPISYRSSGHDDAHKSDRQ